MSAVALERDTVPGSGYLFAAVSESVTPDSRAVRWREHSPLEPDRYVVVIADGSFKAIDDMKSLGKTDFERSSFITGYMELVPTP